MRDLEKILKTHKLTLDEYEQIKRILGKEPSLLELGIFSAMWSEHCSYKSSKIYLKGFPTEAPWVIQGPGENAGVIDIGDGYAAVFKIESHNHPSFIEPYQGAATGVGGILRDVFTMGARPIASLNSIRFADIRRKDEVGKKHRYLLKGVVAGIGGYGNCIGVPTVGGEMSFEDCYEGNILVNAFTIGICKKDEIFYGRASGVGNSVVYVGSKTGRDGLGGAVMASDSFDDEALKKRPTVQVGDPFTQKLLLEACLELFKSDYIVGIQDMGAAGLTSSSFEMASRAGNGMKLYLDRVPMREPNMTPYEIMLSESQERMLICAKRGYEEKVIEIFKKWDLDVEVIGEVTDSGFMEIYFKDELVSQIPIKPIVDEAPVLKRPIKEPNYLKELWEFDINELEPISNQEVFERLISHIEVIDKAWVYEQYDFSVQINTIVGPGKLDASVIRIKENNKALALSVDCNVRFCYLDPKNGSSAAVMEAGRNCVVKGARPLAITDCLNFGNPLNPEVMWQFKESTEGIKEACKALNTPVVSGNVSLYNETNGQNIYPTPTIVMVGLIDNLDRVIQGYFRQEGNLLFVLGTDFSEFGGSLYVKELFNKVAGKIPKVDFLAELRLWHLIELANQKGLIKSAKDINIGGLAIALAKMSALSNLGAKVEYTCKKSRDIFSESLSRAIIEIEPKDKEAILELAKQIGIECQEIGVIGGDEFRINDVSIKLNRLKELYFETFKKIIEQDE